MAYFCDNSDALGASQIAIYTYFEDPLRQYWCPGACQIELKSVFGVAWGPWNLPLEARGHPKQPKELPEELQRLPKDAVGSLFREKLKFETLFIGIPVGIPAVMLFLRNLKAPAGMTTRRLGLLPHLFFAGCHF